MSRTALQIREIFEVPDIDNLTVSFLETQSPENRITGKQMY